MKRFSRLLIVLLILSVLFSLGFLALESGHDCHGEENCPICKIIALLSVFFAAFYLPILFYVALFRTRKAREPIYAVRVSRTLIDLKVKLSN